MRKRTQKQINVYKVCLFGLILIRRQHATDFHTFFRIVQQEQLYSTHNESVWRTTIFRRKEDEYCMEFTTNSYLHEIVWHPYLFSAEEEFYISTSLWIFLENSKLRLFATQQLFSIFLLCRRYDQTLWLWLYSIRSNKLEATSNCFFTTTANNQSTIIPIRSSPRLHNSVLFHQKISNDLEWNSENWWQIIASKSILSQMQTSLPLLNRSFFSGIIVTSIPY